MKIIEKLIENKDKLKIRSDFGIKMIHSIRDNVSKSAIVYNENGIAKVDFTLKQLFLDLNIMSCVLGYDISELQEKDGTFNTEKLCELSDYLHFKSDVFKVVIKELKSRGVYIQEKIDDQIQEDLKYNNSIENLVCEKVNLLISKIPDLQGLIKDLPGIIASLDVDKIKEILKVTEKVTEIKNLKTSAEIIEARKIDGNN